ncbi:MAG: cation transporter [Proteobacteria bacterium]|nr:cation transporter [Pseudomonadota bacterium]
METLKVAGMTCGHCVAAVTKAIRADGPSSIVRIDLAGGTVVVEGRQSRAQLITVIERAGFTVQPK